MPTLMQSRARSAAIMGARHQVQSTTFWMGTRSRARMSRVPLQEWLRLTCGERSRCSNAIFRSQKAVRCTRTNKFYNIHQENYNRSYTVFEPCTMHT